jgi:hypothetical protein
MALEVEVERARAVEALTARDAAIERLSDAYLSLRQKITIIERLQQAPQEKSSSSTLNEQVIALETTVKTLREQLASSSNVPVRSGQPPPSHDEVCSTRFSKRGFSSFRTASITPTPATTLSLSVLCRARPSEFLAKCLLPRPAPISTLDLY